MTCYKMNDNLDIDAYFRMSFEQRFKLKVSYQDLHKAFVPLKSEFTERQPAEPGYVKQLVDLSNAMSKLLGTQSQLKQGFWAKKSAHGT